jgi:drug/metabolite transporter (DMT)-like permease
MHHLSLATAFYLFTATFLWAGNAIAGRILVGSISPIMLSMLRWGLAALFLAPLGWRIFKLNSPLWQNKGRLLVLGLCGVGSYNALLYLALQTSTAINVTLIGASMPIWSLCIVAIFFKVKPHFLQMIGAVISILGVTLVLTRGDLTSIFSMQVVVGDLFILLATIMWAFYSWMIGHPGKSTERAWPWAEFLMAQIALGCLWTVLFGSLEFASGYALVDLQLWSCLIILFVAIGPSLIAYRCWGIGVTKAGPTVASFFANLIPLFTALLSAALLGDPPRLFHGLAFFLIVTGILISSMQSKKPLMPLD